MPSPRAHDREHKSQPYPGEISATAGSAAAQNQDMLDIVKIRIMSNSVTEINAHTMPDLQSAFVTGFQFVLNIFQFFSICHLGRDFNSRGRGKTKHTLLREK